MELRQTMSLLKACLRYPSLWKYIGSHQHHCIVRQFPKLAKSIFAEKKFDRLLDADHPVSPRAKMRVSHS
jgi:hypothetical protein